MQLKQFVDKLTAFMNMISQLPSAVPGENDGRGPFEKTFEAPDINEFRNKHGP